MNERELEAKLELIGSQVPKSIFTFTDGTNATEWNTAFHFATRLQSEFRGYDCDFDLSKVHEASGLYRRPDIVLHKRNTHYDNFLVIEMKLINNPKLIEVDEQKIRDIWFANYHYRFGATVLLNKNNCVVHVERNSNIPAGIARPPESREN